MTLEKKLALLEETIEAEEGTLKPEMALDDVEEYNSLTSLGVVIMLEDNFGKKVSGADMRKLKTVQDLLGLMQ